ncbi:MAG: DUF6785 family protein [Armatimonadota bacterium]|nr:hypothetical protein [bacterium]
MVSRTPTETRAAASKQSVISRLPDAGVTLRAVLLALLLIPIDSYWITVIEVRWYEMDGTCLPIFITPVFMLFMVALANLVVKRLSPRIALRRGELITIYSMIVMGATLASHDITQNLFGTIGHPHYMANATNRYAELFFQYLPSQLFISNKLALTGLYRGSADPWVWQIFKYWVMPLSLWGGLLLVLIGMMMCINIIIRKQWTENEKLVFPLIQLPLAMTAEDSTSKFYNNRLMWGGFAVAAVIGIINGLHMFYPNVPEIIGIKGYDLSPSLSTMPWAAATWGGNGLKIAAYPFAIGMSYFMPLDLSFSCWFFYILRKLWQVFGMSRGWYNNGAGFPYYEAQSSGAWLALGLAIIISAMPYLRGVWRQAWKPGDGQIVQAESRLYRQAFIGLVVGLALLLLFTTWLGMTAWVALVFFVIYFILAISITRVRAELGTPHEIYFVNPQQIMVSLFGYNVLGPANLTIISAMYWFNRCYRSHPMPNQLESFKMAEGTAIKIKPLIYALSLAVIVGLFSGYWANLSITYHEGGMAKCIGYKGFVGAESFDHLSQWLQNKPSANITQISYMIVGAVIVAALTALRGAFVAWPFHPAGYALAVSYAMDYFWFAFLVSWLAKLLIVRYGGMKLHNKLVPFFLGLILGDFFIGSVWVIIGPILGTQAYRIFI